MTNCRKQKLLVVGLNCQKKSITITSHEEILNQIIQKLSLNSENISERKSVKIDNFITNEETQKVIQYLWKITSVSINIS